VDDEKFSPRYPQPMPGFAQPVPKLITRAGDNLFTQMGEAATTCAVYAQKLSPGVHRMWETGVPSIPLSVMPFSGVLFASVRRWGH